MDTKTDPNNQRVVFWGYLGFCLLIFFSSIFLLHPAAGIPHFVLENRTFHTAAEVFGAVLSIMMAIVLWQRQLSNTFYGSYWLSMGFFVMGILTFFHAVSTEDQSFIFLRGLAGLLGSFFFSLIWLPWKPALIRWKSVFAWGPIVLALELGFWGYFFPDAYPQMVLDGRLMPVAGKMNFLAAVLFFLSAIYFIRVFKTTRSGEVYALSCFMLLSGMAAMATPLAVVWESKWWFWHALCAIAYFFVLGCVVRDYHKVMTAQRLHEKELLRNAGFLKSILEAVSQPICVINAWNYKVTMANTAARQLMGREEGTCYSLTHGRDLPCEGEGHKCPLDIIRKTKRPVTLEHVHKGKEGSWWVSEIHAYPILDEKGELREIVEYSFDVTHRKQIEKALKESEEKFREFANHSPSVFVLSDFEEGEKILYANPEFERLFGCSSKELMAKADLWTESIVEEDRDRVVRAYQNFLHQGTPYDVEYRIASKDDPSPKWIHDRAFKIETLSGQPLRLGRILQDINERKNVEQRTRELLEAKESFISSVSHELRTPLTAIKEGISIVIEGILGEVNPRQGEFLNIAKKNVDRLHRLINGVLDFQKLGTGKMAFYMADHDLNDAIREVYDTMKVAADQKKIKLNLELNEKLPLVQFDRDKILQVLTNLFHNAIKFTEQGEIRVTTSQRENTVCVSVADNGPGILAEDLPKLFRSFQQLDNAKEKTGGSGLGLAICHEIILRHRGKIWAESTQGKGSIFHFVLPIQERRNR